MIRPWFKAGGYAWLTALVGGCSLLFAPFLPTALVGEGERGTATAQGLPPPRPLSLGGERGGTEAPLQIQRILLEPENVAKELENVQKGTMLLVPLRDFEARAERVRKAQETRATKPHLSRAHYSAELVGRSFTNGSGKWSVLYGGSVPTVLPIDPLNLALSRLKWEDAGEAILAEFDGKALGLLIKQAGNSTCIFDWSARGTPTNEGIAFNLAIPACALSTFEFTLPADGWLSVPKGAALVTGPHETEVPNKRLWTMQVAGAKQMDLSVRKVSESKGDASVLFARVQSTQKLKPERIEVEHEFQVDILHGSVQKLILEGDAALQPYAVLFPGGEVKDWVWQEIPAKEPKGKMLGAAGLLTIEFHQPVQGKIVGLRVRSLAALPSANLWTSPVLRVRGALARGETMEVHLPPDLPLGKWDYGSFQPTNLLTDGDGTQRFTLADTAPDAASSRRPTLVWQLKGIDLHTSTTYHWQITQGGATLNAEIHYASARGNLFELRVKLPKTYPGYQIEALDMQPAEMLGGWHADGDFLVVELKQPLTPAKKAVLKIQIRSGFREIMTGIRTLPFPELEPIDGTKRQGTLAIIVDPIFQSQLMNSSVPLAPPLADEKGSDPASYRFAFRDQRLSAAVRLVPQPVQVQLHGKHAITLSERHALLQFRWDVQPLVGTPSFLDFRLGIGFPSSWKVNAQDDTLRIHYWERLPLQEALPHLLPFGSPHGLQAAALEAALPTGAYWRFHLSEPLRKRSSFTLEAATSAGIIEDDWRRVSLLLPSPQPWACVGGLLAAEAAPKSSGVKAWSVPLMAPVQRVNVDQEMVVTSPTEPISKVAVEGALQLQKPEKSPTHLQIHQANGSGSSATQITLWTKPEKRPTSLLELCDEASVTTFVYKDGRIYHRVQFRLWRWHDRTCALQFPAGFQILAARLHDHWLERLETDAARDKVRLTLPFDQNAAFVRYEIIASEPTSALLPGLMRIEAPGIDWPSAPLDFRVRFCLEKGWTPLLMERLSPVGVPARIARQTATPRLARQIWGWGQSWWPHGPQVPLLEKMEAQKSSVLLAEAKLRSGADKALKLSEALERFTFDHLKETVPLVIDRVAFRSLGLSSETMISQEMLSAQAARPFWETLGLVYAPCASGALLTSPRRLQQLGINDSTQAVELDEAIQEALLHGRDGSAGFYLIVAWLNLPPEEAHAFPNAPSFAGLRLAEDFEEMSEWEIGVTGSDTGPFHVINPAMARILGWLLALLSALVLWKMQLVLGSRPCFRVYVILLAASILLVLWLPVNVREFFALPTLLVEGIGFFCCIVGYVRQRDDHDPRGHSTVSHPAATSAVVGVLVLGITWSVAAQAPVARLHQVFVIEGAKPVVLLTPDLMARLIEAEKQAPLGSAGAVLVSAKYTGNTRNALATFDVQYEVYSFKDKTNLTIPLNGVQLNEGAFLDGAPVFPAPQKNGYVLPIRGKGAHHLRLSFAVRAKASNEHFDLAFTIPKLSQNEITLAWPAPTLPVHCLRCWGEEKTIVDSREAAKKSQVQLGYENAVHFRWANPAAGPTPKAVEVKEAHFWDLRPGSLALFSSLSYSIGKGSLTQLAVSLPEGLQVRTVEALTPGALPAQTMPIAVKQWTILGKGDQRRLVVDFVQPVTANLTLNLEMVPQAFGRKTQLVLPLPAAQQAKSMGGLLGYRLDVTETRRIAKDLVEVQSIDAEAFDQIWRRQSAPTLPSGTSVSRAYTFQRKASKAGMALDLQLTDREAKFQLQWRLDHHYADLHGKFTIASAQADLFVLEFFVDKSLTIAEVTGPDVRRWQLQDSLLQVWLRQPRKLTTLEMTGWRVLALTGGPAKKTFALPGIYPLQMQIIDSTLEVRPAARMLLELEQARYLRQNQADKNQFAIEAPSYEATFRVATETRPPAATMLTKVSSTEQGMEIWHGIRVTTERGQLPAMKLHLKDWPYEAMLLDAPGALVQPIPSKTNKHPAWTLKYPAGLPQEVFITLRGRLSRDMHTSISLPTVELEGVNVRHHWLAWQDAEILRGGKNLTPQKSARESTLRYQDDAWFKEITSWNFAEASRSLRAAFPKAAARTSVRVLASTENARLTHEHRWLHEASYWIQAPERVELRVKFPAALEVCSVWADRRLLAAFRPTGQEIAIPLEASSQPRLLELRWKYVQRAERMDAPSIGTVQIDQVPLPMQTRMVWVPSGLLAKSKGSPTLVAQLLQSAENHLQISAGLAQQQPWPEEVKKRIIERQRDFYFCVRQAEYALAVLKSAQPAFDRTGLVARLDTLQNENARLAKERGYEPHRKTAAKSKKVGQVAEARHNVAPTGVPFLLSANLPSLALQPVAELAFSEQRTRGEFILLAALFFLVFSYFRHGWRILRLAAPELALGLTVAALGFYGMGLLGVLLIGALLTIRAVWIVAAMKRRLGSQRVEPSKAPPTGAPPSAPTG